MVLTQCPACRTLFQLSDEEQAACGGTVRCGHCGNVFRADVYRFAETQGAAPARRRSWRGLWLTLNVILVLLLVAQGAYWWRVRLANVGFLHDYVVRVARVVGAGLPRPTDMKAFHLQDMDIRKGDHPGVLHIRGWLANTAPFAQSPPLLAVSLLDQRQNLLARRLYKPQVYLRHPQAAIAPHGRVAVSLDLRGPSASAAFRIRLYGHP